jgi:hypothetical protein
MPYTVEKRCPRRPEPERHEEEWPGLTEQEAAVRVEDLAGLRDWEADGSVADLDPGERHVWTDEETGDEVEVRREP